MEEYRCKSLGSGRMELELYENGGPPPGSVPGDLRCPSTSYSETRKEPKRPNKGRVASGSSSASSSKGGWGLSDPEAQRKRRVAGYRAYAVEGRMKGSLRKSFQWIKEKCNSVVHGMW